MVDRKATDNREAVPILRAATDVRLPRELRVRREAPITENAIATTKTLSKTAAEHIANIAALHQPDLQSAIATAWGVSSTRTKIIVPGD
jgi:chromosome segregation and condensation protein ScpB